MINCIDKISKQSLVRELLASLRDLDVRIDESYQSRKHERIDRLKETKKCLFSTLITIKPGILDEPKR